MMAGDSSPCCGPENHYHVSARRGEIFALAGEDSYLFLFTNRNNRSLALDNSKPKGQEILKRLVQRSDVLVEQ